MSRNVGALVAACLAASCSEMPAPPAENQFQRLIQSDPVFQGAMRDPAFRREANDPQFQRAFVSDREFRRVVRLEQSARTHPLVSNQIVDRIEQRLPSHACIGSLERWHRSYSYALDHERGEVDDDKVWFSLNEAGVYGFTAGRRVVRPLELMPGADDRPYQVAFGSYAIATDTLAVDLCGPNVGE